VTNLARYSGCCDLTIFLLGVLPTLWKKGTVKLKTPEAGAATTVTVASLPSIVGGGYYDDCDVGVESESAKIEEDAKALFDYCDEITKEFQ